MRHRVGTTPNGTTVSTFIADVLLCETGQFGSAFDPFFPFIGCQVVDVTVMQGMGDAVLNTLGIAGTQIALGGNPSPAFEMDAAERAGMDTHFASHAGGFINNHRTCFRVPDQGRCGTDLQAKGGFALLTGHGRNGSFIQIDMNPNIGVPALESAGALKRTDPLTIAAAQAPIRFNEYHFHGERFLFALCCRRKRGHTTHSKQNERRTSNIQHRTSNIDDAALYLF